MPCTPLESPTSVTQYKMSRSRDAPNKKFSDGSAARGETTPSIVALWSGIGTRNDQEGLEKKGNAVNQVCARALE